MTRMGRAERVFAKGSAGRWSPATPDAAITLELRLGLMSHKMGPAAGIEPATLCLLGSRSTELSYTGVGAPAKSKTPWGMALWYPAQESNPETAGFADPLEIRLAR